MVRELLNTRIFAGIIKSYRKETPEIFIYRINLENYHQPYQLVDGVPIFNFEYNGLIYPINSRVLCLVKDNDNSQVFVLGQIYDPNINRNSIPANPGETQLNSSIDARSGLGPLGKNDNFIAFGGSSHLKINSTSFKIDVNNNSTLIEGSRGELKLIADVNNSQGILIKDTIMSVIANGGFKVSSIKGEVSLIGDKFSFYNTDSEKPFFYFSKSALRFIGGEYLSIFSSYNITAGNGLIKGKSSTVDWNVIKGSYAIRLGTGDFKVNLLNSVGAEVHFKIGIGPLYLSQFIFDQSSLEVKIGVALPDSLKLGGGSFEVKAGSFPGLQTELLLESSNAELSTKGVFGDDSIKMGNGSLVLKSTKALGGKGKIEFDGDVIITGELIVQDKIYSTDEVFAKATYTALSGATTLSAVKLSTHSHASSIPGGPAPPSKG